MTRIVRFTACTLLAVLPFAMLGLVSPAAQAAPQAAIKCLMIGTGPHKEDGVLNDAIQDIKDHYPTVALTVTDTVEDLKYENLKNYQVLLVVQMKVENGNPPDYVKEGLDKFLKEGGGLVVTHFAVANLQEWRDSIDYLGAMWVNGKSTHGPYHQFRLDIKEKSHPILEGVKPFTTNDELYFNLLMRPDMHILMTANEERFGQTVAEPLLGTHMVYNARCVYFALGHDAASCQPPEFRKILVQSIEWAARKR